MVNSRISKVQMLEKIIFSDSVINMIEPTPETVTLNSNINELDKEWFNFMPASFFVAKYREELQEFKDALYSFYSFKGRFKNESTIDSMLYSVVAELSDVVLAAASALHEHKIDEEIVIADFKGLLAYSLDLANRFNEEIIFTKITPVMINEHHINKIKEMLEAKHIYSDCIYGKEDSKWFTMLLKLHTFTEILDPTNKMKIVKEIRRMKYAMDNFEK